MLDSLIATVSRSLVSRLFFGALVILILLGAELGRRPALTPTVSAVWTAPEKSFAVNALMPMGRGAIPMPPATPAAHASTLLAMPGTDPSALLAFWFAGTRESAPDVQIAASRFDRATQQWSAARFVVNRHALADQLGFSVRRLGNPVAWLDRQGKVHLFVVATGLGGWAAGRIVHLRQRNEGQDFEQLSFEVVRMLPLSWLWNTSFLVRAAPLALADGGMVLPVYFELGVKYPVALHFDATGAFKGMVRISSQKHLLQPTLLMQSPTHWLALMRDQRLNGKVAAAQTMDSGEHWSDLPSLALDNPDSSVAGLAVAPGQLFLAHNSSPHSREMLDLSGSRQGQSWALVQALAHGDGAEYSYPALAWADDSLWVSYTDHRQRIAWQRFSLPPSAR